MPRKRGIGRRPPIATDPIEPDIDADALRDLAAAHGLDPADLGAFLHNARDLWLDEVEMLRAAQGTNARDFARPMKAALAAWERMTPDARLGIFPFRRADGTPGPSVHMAELLLSIGADAERIAATWPKHPTNEPSRPLRVLCATLADYWLAEKGERAGAATRTRPSPIPAAPS